MDNGNYCDKSEESQDNNVVPMTILFDNLSTNSPPELNLFYEKERNECSKLFEKWPEHDQTDFVQNLLNRMTHFQHSQINFFLSPMLQRDFVTLLPQKGLDYIAEKILGYLDGKSLCNAELVCKHWHHVISERMLWKKLIEHNVKTNYLWRELSKRRGWANYLFKNCLVDEESPDQRPDHWFYRRLYPQIIKDIENMEKNWRNGLHTTQKINCRSEASKGVYCLQYDDKQIISGLRDNTIKIWSRNDLQCKRVLTGHTGSVLCLQFDENVIVSGSSDATVRIWDIETGQLRSTLIHHSEAVLHLRFSNGLMVTCSKDRSIAVWDMNSSNDIVLRRVLMGHRAAVNVVDFDEKYIVSASGDRSIKVWNTNNCEFVRTLVGHKRGIACLQYRDNLVVSGSSDNTIRLWDVEEGVCLRVLEGHEELVRCIRFDKKRIVSGAYDGKIKVWDLKAALDPKSNESLLCLKTIVEHTGRVFRLQFDQFQIVSSSHDDTICIMDFLGSEPDNFKLPPLRKVGYSNGINSSNGNGAKLKQQKNLSNGSMNNKDFGELLLSKFSFKLEPNRMDSSTPNNFNKTEHNSLFFGNQPVPVPINVSIDKPMQSSLPINNLNQELVDQEMTNSNEFCILSEFNHQAPVNSSNENQGFEIMDTQKIVDTMDNNHQQTTPSTTNNNSPTLSNSSFNNFLINQHPQQGSANTGKINNITNLTNQLNSTNNNHDNQLVGDLTAINNNLNSSNAELSNSNGTNINNFKGIIPLF